jgi:hypothetical protein
MPFDARNMAALIASDSTTFWFYRTADTRAAVLAPGYFAPAAAQLQSGHVIIAQTADSLSILPVRVNGAVGNGLVLDVVGAPLARVVQAAFSLSGALSAAATFRVVRVDSPPVGVVEGAPFTTGASASGATAAITFRLVNAAGTILQTVAAVPVAAGRASASFTGPAAGSGYRIRAIDSDDSDARSTSAPFPSAPVQQIAAENGAGLTTEDGGILLA